MTDADIAAMELALETRHKPWVAKASSLIARELDDAKAHAAKAVTDALKQTPDGRRSARRIDSSPSYKAAVGHLDALLDRLVGFSKDSLGGLIRDARAAFYRSSVDLWKPHIPEEYRTVPDPEPTREGERLMRGAIVHGYDLHKEIEPTFTLTANQLFIAINQAGRRAATDRQGRDRLAVWHGQALVRINQKVAQALSDSDKAVHEATGLLLLSPQYRGELINAAGDGGLHLPG